MAQTISPEQFNSTLDAVELNQEVAEVNMTKLDNAVTEGHKVIAKFVSLTSELTNMGGDLSEIKRWAGVVENAFKQAVDASAQAKVQLAQLTADLEELNKAHINI